MNILLSIIVLVIGLVLDVIPSLFEDDVVHYAADQDWPAWWYHGGFVPAARLALGAICAVIGVVLIRLDRKRAGLLLLTSSIIPLVASTYPWHESNAIWAVFFLAPAIFYFYARKLPVIKA